MRLTVKKSEIFYVPNDEDKAFIEIHALSKEQLAAIDNSSVEASVNGAGDTIVVVKPFIKTNKIAQACLDNWGGFFNENGVEMKFTPGNVQKASNLAVQVGDESIRLFEWVERCHNELLERVEKEYKPALGN